MQATNGNKPGVKVTEIIGGLKVVTSDVEVQVPVFVPYEVKQPVFIAEEVKVPTGWDKLSDAMAADIYEKVLARLLSGLDGQLEKAIKGRLDTIKVPKLVEELVVTYKDVAVERPIFTDVAVDRPVFKDVEVINPVRRDVEVVNALVIDKPVINCIIEDVRVKNAIIKDVEVERAVIREKVVEVVHKTCLDAKGNHIE